MKNLMNIGYRYGTTFGRWPILLRKVDGQWQEQTGWKNRVFASSFWTFICICCVYAGWDFRKKYEEGLLPWQIWRNEAKEAELHWDDDTHSWMISRKNLQI